MTRDTALDLACVLLAGVLTCFVLGISDQVDALILSLTLSQHGWL